MIRQRNFRPFCSDIIAVGKVLSGDKDLKHVFTSQLPAGDEAGFSFEKNTVFMPKINVYTLTEEESIKFRVFHGHEILHHDLSENEPYQEALAESKTLVSFGNQLEDSRIENNKYDRFRGWIAENNWYRGIELEDIKKEWDNTVLGNPWGSLMTVLQFEIGGFGKLVIPDELKDYYKIGIDILNDGRFKKSTQVRREGCKVSFDLAREILKAWNQNKQKDGKCKTVEQEMEESNKNNFDCIINADALKKFIEQYFENRKVKEGNSAGTKVGKVQVIDSKNAPKGMIEADVPESVSQINEIDYEFYFPLNAFDRDVVAKEFPDEYNRLQSLITDQVQFVKSYLIRYLRALSHTKTQTHLKRGKLDNKALHRLVTTGSKRIFKKTTKGKKLSTSIQLVIDLSGSMLSKSDGLKRSELAAQVATLFGEVFEGLRLPFEIIGYNSSQGHSMPNVEGADRISDIINRWIFKTFKENFHIVKYRLGSCSRNMGHGDRELTSGSVGGCNVDHEVILWGAARLYRQKTTRKIQIVLADGLPSGWGGTYGGLLPRELKRANKSIIKSGIEQFCFGIQCDGVKEYYPNHKILHKLEDLNIEAMKVLADYLTGAK